MGPGSAQAEEEPVESAAGPRPLLTLIVSGRRDSYQAVSCHPGYFKTERQLFLLPAGRIRPESEIQRVKANDCFAATAVRRFVEQNS